MNKVKSITLSIDCLTEIFTIDDATLRDSAISLIRQAASDPDNFDVEAHSDAAPVVLELLRKILHRADSARRRAEARARRRAEPQKAEKVQVAKEDVPKGYAEGEYKVIHIPFNESVARRYLWLKQHLNEVLDNILRAIDFYPAEALNHDFVRERFNSVSALVKAYLQPLINFSADYMRIPRHKRPATVPVNVVA